MKLHPLLALNAAFLLLAPLSSPAQQPSAAERAAALKASIASSQAILRQYEWIETTAVSLKGEEKSREMKRCYHGADGGVQKVPLTSAPPPAKKRGIRGRIAENKKEELTDYMQEAVALVKQYVPPEQGRIQAAKDAGKISITPLPGQKARLTFTDYVKQGDSLAVELDLANNRPLAAKVSSYLDSEKEPVTLDIRFSLLDSNAAYPSATTLNAPGKDLKVVIENSGYRRQ